MVSTVTEASTSPYNSDFHPRIYLAEGFCCQMAGFQCCALGYCNSMSCRGFQLSLPPRSSYLLRHLRGSHCSVLDAHQQSMVHQIRASTSLQLLVLWPWSRSDPWRNNFIWFPARQCPRPSRWMEDHVHRRGLDYFFNWCRDFLYSS